MISAKADGFRRNLKRPRPDIAEDQIWADDRPRFAERQVRVIAFNERYVYYKVTRSSRHSKMDSTGRAGRILKNELYVYYHLIREDNT